MEQSAKVNREKEIGGSSTITLESFGDLDSIFSLSSTNQLNSMLHISGSYEWGATMKFWVNSAGGRVVDTSRKGYLMGGLAQIQESNDLVSLISRERFHDDGSERRVVLWCICIILNLIYITWLVAYVIISQNISIWIIIISATKLLQWVPLLNCRILP